MKQRAEVTELERWIQSQSESDLANAEIQALESEFGTRLERQYIQSQRKTGPIKNSGRLRQEYIKRFLTIKNSTAIQCGRELIGTTVPECPYCGHKFDKMPGRKKRCPACNKDLYVRTRPQDDTRILVREDQRILIEEQWSIKNGDHRRFLAVQHRRKIVAKKLHERFGRRASENAIDFQINKEDEKSHVENSNWGLFRNGRFAMSEIFRKENRIPQCLDRLLEVCYLDLNGPNNLGGCKTPENLAQYPPFNLKDSVVLPGIWGRIEETAEKLHLSNNDLKDRFFEVANRLAISFQLPRSPEEAWAEISQSLDDDM